MEPLLVEIKQDRPGFDRFIGSWVCLGNLNVAIDVGPSNSVHRLIRSLLERGIERIDFVLLSHIHLDHGGGLAEFLDQFPMALAVCHQKGMRHLIEPSKLWESSRKVLGDMAHLYGEPRPVPAERILPHTEPGIDGLEIIETPGHAPHHLSFLYEDHLFVGEAGGNYFSLGESDYLRPATPPLFYLENALESLELILEKKRLPICYSHFGRADDSHEMLKRSREQLLLWKDVISGEGRRGKGLIEEKCVDLLLAKDPNLEAFGSMPVPVQQRERWFLLNSIKGYLGYFSSLEN